MGALLLYLLVNLLMPAPALAVDLSHQYRAQIPQQGETGQWSALACHTFATVALVEAACFRRTGQHLDLSEAGLLYSNYLRKASEKDGIAWQDVFPPLSNANTESSGILGYLDAGQAIKDLQPSMSQGICEENNFLSMKDFYQQVHSNLYILKLTYQLFPPSTPFAEHTFQSSILVEILKQRLDSQYKNLPMMSSAFQQCLASPLKPKKEAFSEKRARELLDRGLPFICHTYVDLQAGQFRFRAKENGPNDAPHETNVVGYEQLKNGKIRWRVRDSNFERLLSATGSCEEIIYLE